jgi:hypothetical protein
VLDQPAVDVVRDACGRRRWRLSHVVPAAVALPHAVTDERFTWRDGDLALDIEQSQGRLQSVRTRLDPGAALGPPPSAVAALARLGDAAVRYADAFGAVAVGREEPLAFDPARSETWTRAELVRRLVPAAAVTLAAIVVALLSPIGALLTERQAHRRVAQIESDRWQAVTTALAELDRTTRILLDLNAFATARPRFMSLLGDLARALPPGTALAGFDASGDRAQLVVITDQGAGVRAKLHRIPGVQSVEVAGARRAGSGSGGGGLSAGLAGGRHETLIVRLQWKPREGS